MTRRRTQPGRFSPAAPRTRASQLWVLRTGLAALPCLVAGTASGQPIRDAPAAPGPTLVHPLQSLGPDQASSRFLDPAAAAMPGRTTHRFDATAAALGDRPYQLHAPGVQAAYRKPLILSITYRGLELDVAPADGNSLRLLVPPDAVYDTTPTPRLQWQPLEPATFSLDGRVYGEPAPTTADAAPPATVPTSQINTRLDGRLGLPTGPGDRDSLRRVRGRDLESWLRDGSDATP